MTENQGLSMKKRGKGGMNQEKTEENKPSFMIKLASFIVDKRNLFFLIFALAIIFSLVSKHWVSVENSLAAFLPDTSETSIGLDRMDENFITYGTAQIMVANISYGDAEELADHISELPYVAMVMFDNTTDHYNDFSALLTVTFPYGEKDDRCLEALDKLIRPARPSPMRWCLSPSMCPLWCWRCYSLPAIPMRRFPSWS